MMKGGHAQTSQSHDIIWGALDHASRACHITSIYVYSLHIRFLEYVRVHTHTRTRTLTHTHTHTQSQPHTHLCNLFLSFGVVVVVKKVTDVLISVELCEVEWSHIILSRNER